jgi:non-heme chloroperoxidase
VLKTDTNPLGTPINAFDAIRVGLSGDRSELYRDLSVPFYGANRPNSTVSQGVRDRVLAVEHAGRPQGSVRLHQGLLRERPHRGPKRIDVPTLIIHGDDDQIVPIDASARRSVELQPYFVAPTVRTRTGSRRRTGIEPA